MKKKKFPEFRIRTIRNSQIFNFFLVERSGCSPFLYNHISRIPLEFRIPIPEFRIEFGIPEFGIPNSEFRIPNSELPIWMAFTSKYGAGGNDEIGAGSDDATVAALKAAGYRSMLNCS